MLDKELIKRNFSQSAPDYEKHAVLQKEMADELLSMIGGSIPKKILDIGCGTGYLTRKLAEKFPEAEVMGIDIAPGMIEVAREKNSRGNLVFEIGDGEELDFSDNQFDLVISNASLQWMEAQRVLEAVLRVLKPNGRFIFNTFGPATLRELRDSGFRTNYFTPADELKKIGRKGFECVCLESEIRTVHFSSVKELIFHLKETGAQTKMPGSSGDRSGGSFKEYREKYGRGDRIPASFEIILGHLVKT